MPDRVDITVVITAHEEGLTLGPTIKSAEAAILEAENSGFSVERLIGLDTPSVLTRSFCSQTMFKPWAISEFDHSDPYVTRNAMAKLAKGKFLAFLDGDDLYSENWLKRAATRLADAERDGDRIIVHPEFNLIFDGGNTLFPMTAQDDPFFLPQYFYGQNYYDMLCMCPRSAVLEVEYERRDISNGYGYQDWFWNIDTMSKGWRHVVEPETIMFKRRRKNSVSEVNREKNAVIRFHDAMAIDNISRLPFSHEDAD